MPHVSREYEHKRQQLEHKLTDISDKVHKKEG